MSADSSPPNATTPAGRTGAYLHLCGLGPAAARELASRPLAEIQAGLDRWAATLVPAQPGESLAHQGARGRAQLLLAEVPARWPDQFLRESPSLELAAAIEGAALQPSRPLRQTIMTPQPIDLGPVSEVADET